MTEPFPDERTTFTGQRPGKVRLRTVPYPYRAALAIANDRHGLHDMARFRELHRFLNTDDDTPFGPGLGLEIADSFWFYDSIGRFSYFKGFSAAPSDQAPLIREFLQAGYIDSLHTWGDFTNTRFTRALAEPALEEMQRHGLKVTVWTNHGDRHNVQNIDHAVPCRRGALPGDPAYHADLLRPLGVRFMWRNLTRIVGQDRLLSLVEYCHPGYYYWNPLETVVMIPTHAVRWLLRRWGHRSGEGVMPNGAWLHNRLINAVELDDCSRLWEFRRFNNHPDSLWRGADVAGLARQLAPGVLDRLERAGGFMVVYTHLELGDWPCPEVITCLQDLARRCREERIWVAATARLLQYNRVMHLVRWSEIEKPGEFEIRIAGTLEDPLFGEQPLEPADLQGLTFEVRTRQERVAVTLAGKPLPVREAGRSGGRVTVMLPVQPLDYPDR